MSQEALKRKGVATAINEILFCECMAEQVKTCLLDAS